MSFINLNPATAAVGQRASLAFDRWEPPAKFLKPHAGSGITGEVHFEHLAKSDEEYQPLFFLLPRCDVVG